MGSRPSRPVPVRSFREESRSNVDENEDDTLGDLVHSHSDGYVGHNQRRRGTKKKPPRRLRSLGADNHQESFQNLTNRLGAIPSSSLQPTPSSSSVSSSSSVPDSLAPPSRTNSMARRSVSPVLEPIRPSTAAVGNTQLFVHNPNQNGHNNHNNNNHSNINNSNINNSGSIHASPSNGNIVPTNRYNNTGTFYTNSRLSNLSTSNLTRSSTANDVAISNPGYNNRPYENSSVFALPPASTFSTPPRTTRVSPLNNDARGSSEALPDITNTQNRHSDGLPGINRTESRRNSYDANPQVYMFLKAQEMGFERERIRQVITMYNPSSLNDLLRRIINHTYEVPPPAEDPLASSTGMTHYSLEGERDSMVEQDTIHNPAPSTPSANVENNLTLPPVLTIPTPITPITPGPPTPSTPGSLSMDGYCVVCLDARADCAIIPCGHLCACLKCSKRLRECPICRANMSGILKIYKV